MDGPSLPTIFAIFGVLTVIFGGVAIMLVGTTKALRDSRDDLEHRDEFLEGERTRDKADLAEKDTAIRFSRSAATADEKLDHLIDLVVSLSVLLTEHHGEARTNWVAVTAGLGHVGKALDKMTTSLEELLA